MNEEQGSAKRITRSSRSASRSSILRENKPHSIAASSANGRDLHEFIPKEIGELDRDHQKEIPRIAKDNRLTNMIEESLRSLPTRHELYHRDARSIDFIEKESVHLVVCSPPYWTLKEYRKSKGQLGYIKDYDYFLTELDRVWNHCYRVLVPGGRLIIVVGDVCVSRRKNKGRHLVVPLHASIIERCRRIGFDNLQGIFWQKIANAKYEVDNGASFLGKPYEPNAIIKNDVEYILMQRKPGGYRKPSLAARILSIISESNHRKWFRLVWNDIPGASTKEHPAPYPVELAERLIRMFSFAGDTILDPFMGTGTTTIAAARCGRNSIGIEVDRHYFNMARDMLARATQGLFDRAEIKVHY